MAVSSLFAIKALRLTGRHQSAERNGRSPPTLSRAVPAIWRHSTSRRLVPWSAWNR